MRERLDQLLVSRIQLFMEYSDEYNYFDEKESQKILIYSTLVQRVLKSSKIKCMMSFRRHEMSISYTPLSLISLGNYTLFFLMESSEKLV